MLRSRLNAKRNNYKIENEYISHEEPDGFVDEQYIQVEKKKFPWKTVCVIIIFLICGAICLAFGILISSGQFEEKYADRAWPLLIVGILMFIPGGYWGYIMVCICCHRDGFTIDDIPEF